MAFRITLDAQKELERKLTPLAPPTTYNYFNATNNQGVIVKDSNLVGSNQVTSQSNSPAANTIKTSGKEKKSATREIIIATIAAVAAGLLLFYIFKVH